MNLRFVKPVTRAQIIYKICPAEAWKGACAEGRFDGYGDDIADGFIHFSTAGQVRETTAKHFAGFDGLVLVAVAAEDLGAALKWEPARNGALFPHLYGILDPATVLWTRPLPRGHDGAHVFPYLGP